MRTQDEYPQRIATLPVQSRRRVVVGPDELAVERVEMFGLGYGGDVDDVGPAVQRDRFADWRGRGEVDRVPVGGLQQFDSLVLGGRVQPKAAGREIEMPAVLTETALANVDDLLALEQCVYDDRPFLECGHDLRRSGHGGQDTADVEEIISEGLRLSAHFARPAGLARLPGLVVLPGFPRGPGGAATVGNTYATLADRISREAGWAALTFTMRGTGASEGDFSIEGWLADVRAAIDALHGRTDITGVWLAGFRLGGTLAIVAAAHDERVRGIATFAAPASLESWVRDPAWFLHYARRTGVLRTSGYPRDPPAWIRAIASLDPVAAAEQIAPRPWLIVHGTADDVVPVDDARMLAAVGGSCAEVRLVPNGAHRLRHDPRSMAALFGWLDRQGP